MDPINENQRSSAENLRESADNKGKRGGRRPGAGAPKGNLNGLKHGLRSKQVARLSEVFAGNPTLQATLIALNERQGAKQEKAEEIATRIFTNLLTRDLKIENPDQARDLRALLRQLGQL